MVQLVGHLSLRRINFGAITRKTGTDRAENGQNWPGSVQDATDCDGLGGGGIAVHLAGGGVGGPG